ncbi:MAG: hypothetical protein LBJ00_15615 [Planctomycetaceae bacterium]|nr:hypothetical protein [Planctomycetaceae bacterium]
MFKGEAYRLTGYGITQILRMVADWILFSDLANVLSNLRRLRADIFKWTKQAFDY